MVLNNKIFIVVFVLIFNLPNYACSDDMYELSLIGYYSSGVINPENLISDDSFYLKEKESNIFFMKYGIDNLFFSIDLEQKRTNEVNQKGLDKNFSDLLVSPYINPGSFDYNGSELKDIQTNEMIEFKGDQLLSYHVSSDGKKLFLYSFSGIYSRPRGIGILSTSSNKKIGINYFEIWDLKIKNRIFYHKKISFKRSYAPSLLFWLNNKRVIIFSNNYNKTLLIIKY